MTLPEILAEAAAGLDGVTAVEAATDLEYRAGSAAFAIVSAAVAEFRLAPVVARAAAATPDAGPSPRGPDWVAFRPAEVDRFARDRATAWFLSAYRNAGGRP